jgi:hypothetical protein
VKRGGAALLLAGLVAFHMRESLLEGRVYFERDLHLQWFGQIESFVHALAAGSLPLWDPWVGFGQPLLANANAQLLYPPTWLNLVLSPGRYYTLYLFAHLLVAGLGAFALSRRFTVSAAGSLVAAALWTVSGPLLSLGNVWNHLAGAALLPWILLAAVRVADEECLRPVATLAGLLALGVLAGSPDFLLLAALPALVLALARPAGGRGRGFVRLAGAAALSALVSAAQLLPSLALVLQSSRAHLDAAVRGYWSIHPWVALQSVVPLAWNAVPLAPPLHQAWFEGREPYLFSLYLGWPALALAGLGLTRDGHRRRFVLLGLALYGLLFALGHHAPFYEGAVTILPPLALIRYPAKAIVLFALGVALLAGAGFDAWRQDLPRTRVAALAIAALALVVATLAAAQAWRGAALAPAVSALARCAALALLMAGAAIVQLARPRWGAALAAGVALAGVLDLSLAHRDLNATAPSDFYRVRPDALASVSATDTQRLLTFDYTMAPGLSEALLHRARPYMVPAPAGPRALWLGAFAMRSYPVAPVTGGFRVFSSFGRDFLGIQPEPLVRLNDYATERMGSTEWARLLARTGVSRLIALHEGALGASLPPSSRSHGPFFEDVLVYRVPDALPRCRVVSGTRDDDRVDTLGAPDFDPRRETLLPGRPAREPEPGFEGACTIRAIATDRVLLESRTDRPALLVLADAWAPGWTAAVDGREVPLLRADVAFRAVDVPAGRHDVAMAYRPAGLVSGAVASIGGLVVLAALAFRAGRTRRAA